MPRESREILFTMPEFMSALMLYTHKRGGESYTLKDIRDVGVDEKGVGTTNLTMKNGEVLKFSEADVISSLILYCRQNNVPLPSKASKKIRVIEEGVVLWMSNWKSYTQLSTDIQTLETSKRLPN
ncbi:MAG: hypothetical protein KUG61_08405 [Parvibaculaceae bacterium]|nr:hypothetical protein [Parvibaculaceae bacterium]